MLTINFNEISIPTIRYGCFSCELDDNYLLKLNGLLKREEFEKSINEINSSCRLSLKGKVSFVICLFSILIGLPLTICGGIIEEISHEKLFLILVAFGVLMIIFGMFFYILCYVKINSNRWKRIKQQVDCQSSKLVQWQIHKIKDSKEFNLIDFYK
ncbi:unnamed protein product [Adineta ricciae]|uniref:Uncharacterized protein n=1 Tax=Adineta ricciae TaxID=249248 RepID=A0A815TKB8_ADIRI|nr:unnamed protein product [Adineta ricciae]